MALYCKVWNNAVLSSKDYEFKTLGGHDAVLNVCRAVQHETWGLKTEDPSEVAGFIRKDHGDFSIGYVSIHWEVVVTHWNIGRLIQR